MSLFVIKRFHILIQLKIIRLFDELFIWFYYFSLYLLKSYTARMFKKSFLKTFLVSNEFLYFKISAHLQTFFFLSIIKKKIVLIQIFIRPQKV